MLASSFVRVRFMPSYYTLFYKLCQPFSLKFFKKSFFTDVNLLRKLYVFDSNYSSEVSQIDVYFSMLLFSIRCFTEWILFC